MTRRWQTWALVLLVAAVAIVGVAIVVLSSGAAETDATATDAASAAASTAAEVGAQADAIDELQARLDAAAAERARLRELVVLLGGDPGPDVVVVNPTTRPQPASSPRPPSPTARPTPSPTARPTPSPSPSCRVPRLPVVGCPRGPRP